MADVRIETLTRAECVTLLEAVSQGRVGLSVGALPVILPVNYAIYDGAILIRTATGTKLSAALRGTVVAFEIDGASEDETSAWSVLVQGRSSVIEGPDELQRVARVVLSRWMPDSEFDHFVQIEVTNVSGRRLVRTR